MNIIYSYILDIMNFEALLIDYKNNKLENISSLVNSIDNLDNFKLFETEYNLKNEKFKLNSLFLIDYPNLNNDIILYLIKNDVNIRNELRKEHNNENLKISIDGIINKFLFRFYDEEFHFILSNFSCESLYIENIKIFEESAENYDELVIDYFKKMINYERFKENVMYDFINNKKINDFIFNCERFDFVNFIIENVDKQYYINLNYNNLNKNVFIHKLIKVNHSIYGKEYTDCIIKLLNKSDDIYKYYIIDLLNIENNINLSGFYNKSYYEHIKILFIDEIVKNNDIYKLFITLFSDDKIDLLKQIIKIFYYKMNIRNNKHKIVFKLVENSLDKLYIINNNSNLEINKDEKLRKKINLLFESSLNDKRYNSEIIIKLELPKHYNTLNKMLLYFDILKYYMDNNSFEKLYIEKKYLLECIKKISKTEFIYKLENYNCDILFELLNKDFTVKELKSLIDKNNNTFVNCFIINYLNKDKYILTDDNNESYKDKIKNHYENNTIKEIIFEEDVYLL